MLVLNLGACAQLDDEGDTVDARGINLTNGLELQNGLSFSNGLAISNGLALSNGLAYSNCVLNNRQTAAS